MSKEIITIDNPRTQYLAEHPQEKAAHDLRMKELRAVFGKLVDGIKPALQGIIDNVEMVRHIGIILTEESVYLPGGTFTRDFYEQMKHELTDCRGQAVPYELCEWSMRVARENREPINDLLTAIKYKQPLLLATGDKELILQSERAPQTAVAPIDPRVKMNKLYDLPAIESGYKDLREKYFVDGKWSPGFIDVVGIQWKAFFDAVDKQRKELGL